MEDNKDMKDKNKDGDYEKYCYLCRRPESKVGKLIYMPNNINICQDCMQKTFDSFGGKEYAVYGFIQYAKYEYEPVYTGR